MFTTSIVLALTLGTTSVGDEPNVDDLSLGEVQQTELASLDGDGGKGETVTGYGYCVGLYTWGVYYVVNGKLYRLPADAPIPVSAKTKVTLHGVQASSTDDCDFTASSMTW